MQDAIANRVHTAHYRMQASAQPKQTTLVCTAVIVHATLLSQGKSNTTSQHGLLEAFVYNKGEHQGEYRVVFTI